MAYLAVQVQTYSFRWGIEDVSLEELAGFYRANSQQSLDSECVEFGVPSRPRRDNQKTAGNTDYLPMQLQYAGILVQVRRMLHDRDIRHSSKSEMEALSNRLREQLESWMQRVAQAIVPVSTPAFSTPGPQAKDLVDLLTRTTPVTAPAPSERSIRSDKLPDPNVFTGDRKDLRRFLS
jgi:hypothetical protein